MRKLDNWLLRYIDYTKDTESAPLFHKWTGISMIASVLQKKVWFNLGRIRVNSNLFIILTAEPGIARKTQALNFGEDILAEIQLVHRSADSTSPQAMLDDLEAAQEEDQLPSGEVFKHNSLSVISGEFESFLGQKKDNTKMLITLTDLFDCKQRPYKTHTRHSGNVNITSPWLNVFAATTPSSLANCLPSAAIGGGLTTRILFIWADAGGGKCPIPEETEYVLKSRELLIHDLSMIRKIAGNYDFAKSSKAWWIDWYNKYEQLDPNRLCKEPAFAGWYSRKPLFILKLAMILTAAKHSKREVEIEEFQIAIELLEEIEGTMANTFVAVGRSELATDINDVTKILKSHRVISEKALLSLVWKDMDINKFDPVIMTIKKRGDVRRDFKGPDGKAGIWYTWIGEGS